MSSDKLQVIVDQLRELPGYQDVARWIERPDVVRALLSYVPATGGIEDGDSDHCAGCDASIDGSGQLVEPHDRRCRVLVMWQVLGHPLGDPAIEYERAWDRAIRQEQNRDAARRAREEYARRRAAQPPIRIESSKMVKDGEVLMFQDRPRGLDSPVAIQHSIDSTMQLMRPWTSPEGVTFHPGLVDRSIHRDIPDEYFWKTLPTRTIPTFRKAGEPVDPSKPEK